MQILSSVLPKVKSHIRRTFENLSYQRLKVFGQPSNLLAVTYANDQKNDGAGAQLQRIYGIYAISKLLKVGYIHSPLTRLDYQGLEALEDNSSRPDLVDKYNKIFRIDSSIPIPDSC